MNFIVKHLEIAELANNNILSLIKHGIYQK